MIDLARASGASVTPRQVPDTKVCGHPLAIAAPLGVTVPTFGTRRAAAPGRRRGRAGRAVSDNPRPVPDGSRPRKRPRRRRCPQPLDPSVRRDGRNPGGGSVAPNGTTADRRSAVLLYRGTPAKSTDEHLRTDFLQRRAAARGSTSPTTSSSPRSSPAPSRSRPANRPTQPPFREGAERLILAKARQLYLTAENRLRSSQPPASPLSSPGASSAADTEPPSPLPCRPDEAPLR